MGGGTRMAAQFKVIAALVSVGVSLAGDFLPHGGHTRGSWNTLLENRQLPVSTETRKGPVPT